MPTKVSIIEIDLGVNVSDIITGDVQALTEQAQAELDQALDTAKTIQRVKEEKETAAKAADAKLAEVMATAYDQLVAAGEIGLPVSTVMAIVADEVPNSSAFTLRMKKILAEKGNPFYLERIKRFGTAHYCFMPFNQPQPTS